MAGGLAAACLVLAELSRLPGGGTGADANTASGGASAGAEDWSDSTSSLENAPSSSSGEAEQSTGSAPEDGGSGAENLLYTPAGTYVLTGEIRSTLPEDSWQLGVLFLQGEDNTSQLYTARREYAGCVLWEGPDGTLYVQLSGGNYAEARPME